MGTGQLVCLILGVLFLAAGGGMLGGRLAPKTSGAAPIEFPINKAEPVGTPAAKPLFSDSSLLNGVGATRETASAPESSPVENPSAASEKNAPAAEDPVDESRSKYVIQAISTSSRADARAAREAIAAVGFPSGVFEAELPGRGKWYRVYIGPYDSEKEARSALEKVQGIPGFEGSFLKAME